MLNQVVVVGRLVKDPEVEKTDNDKEVSNLTLAVPRSYKNADGVYETDFIDCVLWNSIATNTAEYCKKGDLIGIKGRVQSNTYETESGETKKSTQIVAEKVTFLSSKNQEKDNDDLSM
ncbi:MAG: single-stranded DNA-binding protein [Bacilli bacterium]|nr:single-stranded DNA-binding protein [Bacilli bacterium]MDD4808452.1 single-stranded DNA-binding protein [Bacilli bacterium]